MSKHYLCMHILCRYHEFVSVSVCKGGGGDVCVWGEVCVSVRVHVEVVIYVWMYF